MKYWVGVLVYVLLAGLGSASAGNALDKPAFTATPAELLALAKTAPAGDWPAVILRDETDLAFDAQGRRVRRWRYVFVVRTQAGVDDWGTLSMPWSPFYQDKPEVRGRVIEPDGRVTAFDPKLFSDAPTVEKSANVFSDERSLSIPLPRLSVGAVIEEEVITRDRVPLLEAGVISSVWTGNYVPAMDTRIVLSAPTTLKAKVISRGLPKGAKPRREASKGRDTWTLELGKSDPVEAFEPSVPADAHQRGYLAIATGASWNAVAREYRKILDKRITEGPVTLPANLPRTPTLETVRAIVGWLHAQIRYTGIEYGEASIVPWPPAETMKRGFGDCKDKATLLVALLRQAGIRADLALLRTGPDIDVEPDLPGMGWFDHAIVRAKVGTTDVWIDATEDLVTVGALPSRDRDRRALIVADDTQALVKTPSSRAQDNVVHEVRTFELAEAGSAKITEVSRESGVFEAELRSWIRDGRTEDVRKLLATYIKRQFNASTLDSFTTTPPTDLARPFEMTVVGKDALGAYTDRDEITVYLYPGLALSKIPDWLKTKPDDKAKPRRFDLEWFEPHMHEIENKLILPPGFTAPALPPDRVRNFGSAKLTERHRLAGNTLTVSYIFESGAQRVPAKDVAEMQKALAALGDEHSAIVIESSAASLMSGGKVREAIAEVRKLIALHPKESVHQSQLARVLLQAGAGHAARRAAKKAVELEPNNADAHASLAYVLRHDTLGRDFGFDFDRAGALAALARARKLDPSHVGAAVDHAVMLQRGTSASDFGPGSDVKAAVDAWRSAYALDQNDDNARAFIRVLLWNGLGTEAEKVARERQRSDERDSWLVAATAVAKDANTAIGVATSLRSGTTARNTLLDAAGGFLFAARKYDLARGLYGQSGALTANTQQAPMLQRMKIASAYKLGRDPKHLVRETMNTLLLHKTSAFLDASYAEALTEHGGGSFAQMAKLREIGEWFIEDLFVSLIDSTVEGRPDGPWKVTSEFVGKKFSLYAVLDGNTVRAIAAPEAMRGLGKHALLLLTKRDEVGARQLLDWAHSDLVRRAGNDPTFGKFEKLWDPTRTGGKAEIELAAAVLANAADADRTIPILTRCATTIAEGRAACDLLLAWTLRETKRWKELDAHTVAWLQREPSIHDFAVYARVSALIGMKRTGDAGKFLDELAAKQPTDRRVGALRSEVNLAHGDVHAALQAYDAELKVTQYPASVRNHAAWLHAAARRDLTVGLDLARAAVRDDKNNPSFLNTLAVLEAETGDLKAARTNGYRAMELAGRLRPGGADLYLIGRILEQLDQRDDAIAAYKAIKPPPYDGIISEHTMAQERLKALGVKR